MTLNIKTSIIGISSIKNKYLRTKQHIKVIVEEDLKIPKMILQIKIQVQTNQHSK